MLDLRDNPQRSRYELFEDGEQVGFLDYRRDGDVVSLTHAEVRIDRRGEGLGDQLVAAALRDVRAKGERVVPVCRFVVSYMRRHREEADLLAS